MIGCPQFTNEYTDSVFLGTYTCYHAGCFDVHVFPWKSEEK